MKKCGFRSKSNLEIAVSAERMRFTAQQNTSIFELKLNFKIIILVSQPFPAICSKIYINFVAIWPNMRPGRGKKRIGYKLQQGFDKKDFLVNVYIVTKKVGADHSDE